MPTFKYRAVNENGVIVQNRVDEINRKSLIRKLKRNSLTPINIVQVNNSIIKKTTKKQNNKSS